MLKRKSIIVYFKTPKVLKRVEQLATISYYNKKRRYAICYVNEEDIESITNQLRELKAIKRVEVSLFETDEYQLDLNVK